MEKPKDKASLNISASTHMSIRKKAAALTESEGRYVSMMDVVDRMWETFTRMGEATKNKGQLIELSATTGRPDDIFSNEALNWARLAEVARHVTRRTGRQLYESVFLQLRMVAEDALDELGGDAKSAKLPSAPNDHGSAGPTGKARKRPA